MVNWVTVQSNGLQYDQLGNSVMNMVAVWSVGQQYGELGNSAVKWVFSIIG